MVDISYDGNDRWVVPDDRQLALRGRLETGWSSYKGNIFSHGSNVSFTEEEQQRILSVLQKQEVKQKAEERRIGLLVKHLEDMRKNVLGDGQTTCLICGTKTGLLKDSSHYCCNCRQMVCSKCGVESCTDSKDASTKLYFCVICYEDRQLWKRSGAWFYNAIPKYELTDAEFYPMTRSGTINYQQDDQIAQHSVTKTLSGQSRTSKDSFLVIQRSGTLDDGSDDSDIETASSKAFDIPEDQRSITWHGQIDIDEENVFGRSKRSSDVLTSRPNNLAAPSIEFSSSIDGDHHGGDDDGNFYGSQSSLSKFMESPNINQKRMHSFDRQTSEGSLASVDTKEKKHKLGIRKPWRKKSKDAESSHSTHDQNSTQQLSNSHETVGDSVSNASSEQDIDSMFQSYKTESSCPREKTDYHGTYGMVEFTLQYDPNTQELLVILHQCKGLKSDKGKSPSTFIKTYLLPEATKASKKRTTTIKRTSDPVFDETMIYHGISETDIKSKGLRLSVMEEGKIGSNEIIGETSIPLKNLTNRPVQQFRRILDARSNDETLFLDSKNTGPNPGRIEIALHYLSKQEKLVVEIIRCAGLKSLDPNGYSDPYVKCYLLPDPHKRTKQKTAVKKKTLNPEFHEEFYFNIAHGELAKRTLHVSVWDYDMGRTNDLIGEIMLGIDSTGNELRHWFETCKTADKRVIKWHTLNEHSPIINE